MKSETLDQVENITALTEELIGHGEDGEELRFWAELFPTLAPEHQEKLLVLLSDEKKALLALAERSVDRGGE